MKYHSLASDDRIRRRTIADAIEVLHSIPDFTEQSRASVQVDPLPLASGEIVGLVKVQCNGPLPEVICVVQMPTSSRFRAVRKGSSHQESFDIFRLDGAAVDGAGNVKLADDARLRESNSSPYICRLNLLSSNGASSITPLRSSTPRSIAIDA